MKETIVCLLTRMGNNDFLEHMFGRTIMIVIMVLIELLLSWDIMNHTFCQFVLTWRMKLLIMDPEIILSECFQRFLQKKHSKYTQDIRCMYTHILGNPGVTHSVPTAYPR